MTYKWRQGSHIKTDANIAGRFCEELEKTVGLTAKNLVDASREETAPLHNEFEWDNDVASEKWREQQARVIISGLTIVRENSEPIRKFFNIEYHSPEYKSIEAILESKDEIEKLIEMAKNELSAFSKKYATVKQLENIVGSINHFLQEVS